MQLFLIRKIMADKVAIMADYLSPNTMVSVEEQGQLFQVITRVNPLHSKKGKGGLCLVECANLLRVIRVLKWSMILGT